MNIIGRPNVGKSTLMNALVGEKMSIITAKPQTTRHRIIGILSGEDFQLVFSDTPGVIEEPTYKMQEVMNRFALSVFEDADLLLFVTEPEEAWAEDDNLLARINRTEVPVLLVFNKKDLCTPEQVDAARQIWKERLPNAVFHPISALQRDGTVELLDAIKQALPEGPEYYPKDQLTDRTERFFISEIIREKILEQYHQEIPYNVEVAVTSFKEGQTAQGNPIVRIDAIIFTAKNSHKPILLGKEGKAIKKLGIAAREAIEAFLEQKVHLDIQVKLRENWRDDDKFLRQFGYQG